MCLLCTFTCVDDALKIKFGYTDSQEEHDGHIPLQYLKKHSYSPRALQRKQELDKPLITVCLHCMISDIEVDIFVTN